MNFFFSSFHCPTNLAPHLNRVFAGEYDVPLNFPAPPRILDLGANVGSFSLWASHRWPGAEIHAYEPHPRNVVSLWKNLENYKNVIVHAVGVGRPGLRALYEGPNNDGEHSFYVMANNPTSHGQHIEVIDPLDLPEADLLKMDIEGCEIEVLPKLIEAGRTFSGIMFEYHHEDIRRELDQLLKDYQLIGHEIYTVGRGTVRYVRKS